VWSLKFAGEVGADLTVLHVVDTGLTSIGNLVAVPNAVEELRQRAEERIAAWRRELDLSRARVEFLDGPPADRIVETADGSEADLLVMGTHGLSGFQKLLLGSVTEKVLHRVRKPLLSISAQSEPPGETVWAPKRILMAVDFGPESASVVRHGVWLGEHYGAELVAANVVPVPYVVLNDRTVERLSPEQLERLKDSLTSDRRARIEQILPASPGVKTSIATAVGAPFDSLRDMVRDHEVDLVVMGAGGHGPASLGWLGSTCHKMVRSAACPVLVVR
jgi:nucleotide-binding universal stress UspA family protein